MVPKFTYSEATASAVLFSGAESVRTNHSPGHLAPSTLLVGWAVLPKGHTPALFWKKPVLLGESHGIPEQLPG